MKKKTAITSLFLLIIAAASGFLFFLFDQNPVQEQSGKDTMLSQKPGQTPPKELPGLQKKPVRNVAQNSVRDESSGNVPEDDIRLEKKENESFSAHQAKYIEDIKKQIYDRNIEYVEQIPLLDDLVQTGDQDVMDFWGNDWISVDDWKKEDNGFKLEKNSEGNLVFTPDQATASKYTFFENPQAYTYDEKNREFVNEVDYYGKTIYNVVKFIKDDVLVMMTISGIKVDLHIYTKNAG
jgi:hypothetical protein